MKCNATIAVVGRIMAYETCGIPKILMRIRHWKSRQCITLTKRWGYLPAYKWFNLLGVTSSSQGISGGGKCRDYCCFFSRFSCYTSLGLKRFYEGVHKVRFPLVPQPVNNLLRKAIACRPRVRKSGTVCPCQVT